MIKNLIFDFGDVLINLDKTAIPNGISAYGKSSDDPALTALAFQYEQGKITSDHFIQEISLILGEPDFQQLKQLWNSIIADFPLERLTFMEKLAQSGTQRLFLLSNTNELHIDCVREVMTPAIYERFQKCFEGFYLSHEIKMRKPDAAIFEFVLNKHQLKPSETLFIDDTREHIDSASALGIHTWHLQVGQESVHALPNYM